jgi:DivIVA domain-containing protein
MALDFQRPDPSSPAAVASAQFTVSRRGYREEEVRDFLRQVSVELARLLERERFLESELKALQARGPVDVAAIDEAAVTELLGAEAARVLTSARDAAQAIRDRAAESAEQIVRDASREATRLLEESTMEASRRRSDVSGEAEQELELAKQQGREMIAEVRAYRERVLTDLAKRTEEARRDLERLVHERERLLGAFERARHAATDVVGDLNEFDQTLRGTGVTPPLIPPDAPPPPRPSRTSDTPIFDAKEYAHELGEAHRDESEDKDVSADDLAADTVGISNESEAQSPSVMIETSSSEVSPVPESPTESGSLREIEASPSSSTPEHIAEVVNIFDRQRKRESSRPTPENDAPEHPVFDRVHAQPEDEPATPVTSRVDEIFARLRTGSTERVAKESTNDLVTGDQEPTSTSTTPTAVTPPVVQESVFSQRKDVVEPGIEAMTRALKRLLADDENAALTHVRAKRTSLTLSAMLAPLAEHAQRYAEAIHETVTSIAVDGARSLSDSRRADLRSTIARGGVVEAVCEMLASDLLRPLHERFASAIDIASGDRDVLASALRSLFQEWKSKRLSLVIADIAHFTYARGVFLGCDGAASVCWAVDPNGPACADAEDNALAGVITHGEHFPTGHQHPLAHAGCRCLVVPLDK